MKRFNFFIDQKWIDKMEKEKERHGISSVAGFIRFIIVRFFEKTDH